MRTLCACLLALTLLACDGDPPASDAGLDAAVPTDAGRTDAGSPTEDGGSTDAGSPDGGGMADAASDAGGSDAGMSIDAGDEADAGPPADCVDAEIEVDDLLDETTVGAGDDHDATGDNCPRPEIVSGPDRVYGFTAPVAGTFRITVVPEAGFNPMLYVRSDCDAPTCLEGTNFNGAGGTEVVDITLAEGQRVVIFVDTDISAGPLTSGGQFLIEITLEE